jgi:hypothetical protein
MLHPSSTPADVSIIVAAARRRLRLRRSISQVLSSERIQGVTYISKDVRVKRISQRRDLPERLSRKSVRISNICGAIYSDLLASEMSIKARVCAGVVVCVVVGHG